MNLRVKNNNSSNVKVLSDKTNVKSVSNVQVVKPVAAKSVVVRQPRKPKPKENNENKTPPLKKSRKTKAVVVEKKSSLPISPATVKPPETPYCFGFSESDDDYQPCDTELTKFDPSKPYRLSLYVKPSRTIRLNPLLVQKILDLNPTLNLTYNDSIIDGKPVTQNRQAVRSLSAVAQSPDPKNLKLPFSSTPKPALSSTLKPPLSSTPKPKPLLAASINKGKMVQTKITEVFKASPKRTRTRNEEKQFTSFFDSSNTSDDEVIL